MNYHITDSHPTCEIINAIKAMCTYKYAIWIGIVIRDLQGIAGTASFVVGWNSKNTFPNALYNSDWYEQCKLKILSVSSLFLI